MSQAIDKNGLEALVRPLEWSGRFAVSVTGIYSVNKEDDGWWWGKEGIRRHFHPIADQASAKAAAQADYVSCILSAFDLSASPQQQAHEAASILANVRNTVREAALGMWRTCSGCHESEDGYDVGHYPFSADFGCKLGAGCHECGGIGAVWDTTDYAHMGDVLAHEAEPSPAAQPVAADFMSLAAHLAKTNNGRAVIEGEEGVYVHRNVCVEAMQKLLASPPRTEEGGSRDQGLLDASEAGYDAAASAGWDFIRPKLLDMNREKGPAGVWSNGFNSGWNARDRALKGRAK